MLLNESHGRCNVLVPEEKCNILMSHKCNALVSYDKHGVLMSYDKCNVLMSHKCQVMCLADFFQNETVFLACGHEKLEAKDFCLDKLGM